MVQIISSNNQHLHLKTIAEPSQKIFETLEVQTNCIPKALSPDMVRTEQHPLAPEMVEAKSSLFNLWSFTARKLCAQLY